MMQSHSTQPARSEAARRRIARLPGPPATRPPLPDDKNRLDGLLMGGLLRVSTPEQVDNDRAQAMAASLFRDVEKRGGTLDLLDEQGISGRRLSKRAEATRLLDMLATGERHGLAVPDLKRLTRDEFGIDAATIRKRLVEARAPLLAGDRVYYLWDKRDGFQYGIETQVAGQDVIGIRDQLWDGVFWRAEHEPFFHGVKTYGYLTDIIEVRNRKGHLKIKRKPRKDPAAAEAMAHLVRCLDECPPGWAYVARRMNDGGFTLPIARGPFRGQPRRWNISRIKQMLDNPMYQGVWDFGHSTNRANTLWELDGRRDRLGPKDAQALGYDLAYWTPADVRRWLAKYAPSEGRAKVKGGAYDRPLTGLLCCLHCGRPLVAGGILGYQCRVRSLGSRRDGRQGAAERRALCPASQTISHRLAVAAVRALLPRVLHEADQLEAAAREELGGRSGAERLRSQIAVLEEGLNIAAEQWYGKRMPDAWAARVAADQEALDRAREGLQREEALAMPAPEAEAAIRRIMSEPDYVDELEDDDVCWLIREVVKDVRLEPVGPRGHRRAYRAVQWTSRKTGRVTRVDGVAVAAAPTTDVGGDAARCTLANISALLDARLRRRVPA